MTREDLEHLIGEAGRVAGTEYVWVIGSAAILATIERPDDAVLTRTRDADIAPGDDDPRKADRIDFALGELSAFDNRHNYYAQGVSLGTARFAPRGWQARTIPIKTPRTRGVTGLCIDVHDLALSKYGAGRPKDLEFTRSLAATGAVRQEELLSRLVEVECDMPTRALIETRIRADYGSPMR
jgi:hypothetical protein